MIKRRMAKKTYKQKDRQTERQTTDDKKMYG